MLGTMREEIRAASSAARQRDLIRTSPSAASVPRMVATTVVPRATWTERPSASIHSELEKKRWYCVRPGALGISSNTIDELNDIGITESTGTTRKARTEPPAVARAARAARRFRRRVVMVGLAPHPDLSPDGRGNSTVLPSPLWGEGWGEGSPATAPRYGNPARGRRPSSTRM